MRRVLLLMLAVAATIAMAGCGGQNAYHITLPSGKHVTAAHPTGFGKPPKNRPRALGLTAVPLTLVLDTVDNPSSAFAGLSFGAVAGYTSGSWPTYWQMIGRYPHVISVAVNTGHYARCLDVEPGDADPSQVVGWFYADVRAGYAKPCFYASLGNGMIPIQHNLSNAGIARARYFLWDADWTYSFHLDAGYDATQWTDHYAGRNDDGTAATLNFVGIQPAPLPVCTPYTVRLTASACAALRKNMDSLRRGRDSSLRAYYHRIPRCTQPVLTRTDCATFASRVDNFQQLRNRYVAHPICFGRHAQLGAPECQIVRPAVAAWTRAVASTVRAEGKKGCKSAHNSTCTALRGRKVYFRDRIEFTLSHSALRG